ncbi:MAG: hypothetical protein L0221_17375, partial [Chloroflexi bacterium]|nr:hypothetical protein [Chloroflexota bacterium]
MSGPPMSGPALSGQPEPAAGREPEPAPDVVVVGSASRDITPDDPRGWRLGGAVSYGALTLARLGLRVVAIVGADARVAESRELAQIRDAGVDVRLVELGRSPVFE